MSDPIDRRTFAALNPEPAPPHPKPAEAPFDRDYPPPGFQPSWKKPHDFAAKTRSDRTSRTIQNRSRHDQDRKTVFNPKTRSVGVF